MAISIHKNKRIILLPMMDYVFSQRRYFDEKKFKIKITDKGNEIFNHLHTGSKECIKFRLKKLVEPKEGWDLIKLLNFLSFMPQNFISTIPLRTQKNKKKFY